MAVNLTPGVAIGIIDPTKKVEEKWEWPAKVQDVPIPNFDTGVFIAEMANLQILPQKFEDWTKQDQKNLQINPELLLEKAQAQAPPQIERGTYRGTQLALNKLYELVEKKYSSFMDTCNFEPTVPSMLPLEKKRAFFSFTDPADDSYPPHLNLAANKQYADMETDPNNVQKSSLGPGDIFNKLRLAQLASLITTIIPKTFLENLIGEIGADAAWLKFGSMGTPDQGQHISDVEQYNKQMRDKWFRKDIFDLPNIGDLEDWYTDARFAQQNFTGTNPATIELASDFWINHFISAARQQDAKMKTKIQDLAANDKTSLYMQDYSYFRDAANYVGKPTIAKDEVIKCAFEETYTDRNGKIQTRTSYRYGVASVCLFHLNDQGQLNPLAIVLDWRGSAEKSLTVYNKQLPTSGQGGDWVWRYAKTCVQTSDWLRHEVTVHLTNCHLIEEATIVGANRELPGDHPVFRILYPHWQKTLSLNAAARDTLVPQVIIKLIGLSNEQAGHFIQHAYNNFDFAGNYVPKDLERRGFPPEKLNDRKYHNYAYARCVHSMWYKIRSFVSEMLAISYPSDAAVATDDYIKNWYTAMRADASPKGDGGANMKSFPEIHTFEELVDAVTMCIHIASPQHTAVNYLQNYYQSFVINKPPCLYQPPPTSYAELDALNEAALVAALPMNHPQEWLLASHIPYLLSFKPGDRESLIIYAASKFRVYEGKTEDYEKKIAAAAAKFYEALAASEREFKGYGMDTDDSDVIKYDVLSPSWNAVSILI